MRILGMMVVSLVASLCLPILTFAQKLAPSVEPEELREGTTLTCLSVLKGEEPSAFKMRFIGTRPFPVWPKERLIVAEMKDKKLPVTAGMSGSPCFEKERFVGALSYNLTLFPMGAGLAGITPARALRNPDAVLGGASPHTAFASGFAAPVEIVGLESRKIDMLNKFLGTNRFIFQPGEIGEGSLDQWSSSGASQRRIRPGESVTGLLVDGAVRVGFTCTVAEATDKDFSVCGHDVFNEPLEYPAYRSRITAISRSNYYSYKIVDRTLEPVGTFTDDTIFRVKGVHEVRPHIMLPVHFTIFKNGKPYEYDFRVLRHRFLSTLLVQWGIEQLLANQWSPNNTATAKLAAQIYLKDRNEPLVIYDSSLITMQYVEQGLFEGYLNPWRILNNFRQKLAQIQGSEFNFTIEKVNLTLHLFAGNRVLMLDSLAVLGQDGKPTDELRAGQAVTVILGMRNEDASQKLVRRFVVEVPSDLNLVKPGDESIIYEKVQLIFMSGNRYEEMDPKKLPRAKPDSPEEFLRQFTLNQREPSEMFAVLVLPQEYILEEQSSATPELKTDGWTEVENFEFLRERNRASEPRVLAFSLGAPLKDAIVDFFGGKELKLILK